ncbi:MAG: MBL fold metallo-hydrolase [Chitinophagales bacterium]|nr:MBL fold metallo-hydrolase [Chitinophagales bacterium]
MKFITLLTLALLFVSSCSDAKTKKNINILSTDKTEPKQTSNFIEQKINDNFYILRSKNYRTNIGVFIGDEEIVLVDPMAGVNNHQALLEKIKELSEKPIKYVINTHSHSDHSGANSFFADIGAIIVSQENSKFTSEKTNVTFKDRYTIKMGNETIEFFHVPSHSIDDVIIYFSKNNVVFMGDVYMTNALPHFYFGGGGSAHIEILNKALSLGNDNTLFIAGHGDLSSNREELKNYRENSNNWINRIKELHNQIKSIDEIADDNQIKELGKAFNDNKNFAINQLKQTIGRSISSDLVVGIPVPMDKIKTYEGSYLYADNTMDKIVLLGKKLFVLSGGFMFELIPLSETKFHIRGHAPHRHITFKQGNKELIYFDGTENKIAKRQ